MHWPGNDCRLRKRKNGYVFAFVKSAPYTGEIFKNIADEDLIELGQKPSYPHTPIK